MVASDLLLGLAVLCLLSTVSFLGGLGLARRGPSWAAAVCFGLAAALALGASWRGELQVLRWVPFSNAILIGNWLPASAALLMGGIAGSRQISARRRVVWVGVLGTMVWYPVFEDLLGAAPPLGPPRYYQGFCLQSTPASCSACCAASLLMFHGIQASEAEMVALCLTRFDGTPTLGLYRGLKRKTRDTPWDVDIVCGDFESLRSPEALPAIVFVRVGDQGLEHEPTAWFFLRQWHAVVIYDFDGDHVEVGDPAIGLVPWRTDRLRRSWNGSGLRLVPRDRTR